ncbi:MAG TPA: HEAT repeat domain-containing protein [Acidobacteriota bacterium]|jgi:anti-sigma factor RsiW
MNHKQFRDWIQLSLYDELDEEEQHLLERHLEACEPCRAELREFKSLHETLEVPMSESIDPLLKQAREELHGALRLERSRRSTAAGWIARISERSVLGGFRSPVFLKVAAAAVLMLSAGIFIGYVTFRPGKPGPSGVEALADVDITNVRILDSDANDGQVELSFDATRRVRLRAGMSDERVQKVLARALVNSQNPGVRLNAINAIRTYQHRLSDREVKSALIMALQSDDNPGVRKEALMTLQKYPFDEEMKRAFLHVLVHDNNPGLRIEAIRSLQTAADQRHLAGPELVGILKDKMNSDDNNYVRIRAKSVLEEVTQR